MFKFPTISHVLEPEEYFLFAGCSVSHVLPLQQDYQWENIYSHFIVTEVNIILLINLGLKNINDIIKSNLTILTLILNIILTIITLCIS